MNNTTTGTGIISIFKTATASLLAAAFVALLLASVNSFGQAANAGVNNRNSPESTARSDAHINPTTLGLELSIPLGIAPGRAGNSLPMMFNYSSKVWRMEIHNDTSSGFPDYTVEPIYGENSDTGWTTSLQSPYFEDTSLVRLLPSPTPPPGGGGGGGGGGCPGACAICYPQEGGTYCVIRPPRTGLAEGGPTLLTESSNGYEIIPKVTLHLPDGSTRELVASLTPTTVRNSEPPPPTVYFSIDGSNLKYVKKPQTGESTLFMPDGSRYEFDGSGTRYVDRNGNLTGLSSQSNSGQWTDTMGRSISNIPTAPIDPNSSRRIPGDVNYAVPSLQGNPRSYIFKWRNLSDSFAGSDYSVKLLGDLFDSVYYIDADDSFNPVVLQEIDLPNGQSYRFDYNEHGEIEQISYPEGSVEKLKYAAIAPFSYAVGLGTGGSLQRQGNRGVVARRISPDGTAAHEMLWTYEVPHDTNLRPTAPYKIVTTAPDLSRTESYLYVEVSSTGGNVPLHLPTQMAGKSYEQRSYDTNRALASRSFTKWTGELAAGTSSGSGASNGSPSLAFNIYPRIVRQTNIVIENGQALAQSSTSQYDNYLNVVSQTSFDFVPLDVNQAAEVTIDNLSAGTALRTTQTNYQTSANYLSRQMVSLPSTVVVRQGDNNGAIIARSEMLYDQPDYAPLSVGTLSGAAASSWIDPVIDYRGNATTVKMWTDVVANQSVETHAQYDNFGNLRKSWDANGNLSTTDYSAAYHYAYPTSVTGAVPDPGGVSGSSSVLTTSIVYDYATGLPTSSTDANGQTTTMEYNDPLLRPTRAIAPNGQQTITEYGAGVSAATRFVHTKTQIDEVKWKEGYSWYDGLGRTVKAQSVDSNGDVLVDTEYDQFGRPWKTTNPYRAGETIYKTENFYDTAGRLYKVKSPDNAEVTTAYGLATTGARIGTVVTVTDQAGKQRRSVSNALGQLTEVDEPNDGGQLDVNGTAAQPTSYLYDTLGNLTTVTQASGTAAQCGGAANCSQTRSFVYDSLSRLKQATNPESGTISYIYDSNGNLTNKTDARGVQTSYIYDALNRVTNRNYLAPAGLPNYGATRNVAYTYDNLPYAKGKLTKVSSADSTTEYTSFDSLGRVLAHRQATDGNVYQTGYNYNLSGALIEETYPSGRVVKNTLDADGDLAQVQSKKNQNAGYQNYAGAFTYTAAGAVSSMRLGNGRWESTIFNSRLQPTQIALGNVQNAANLLKLNYDYGSNDNNGNVKSQQITVPTIGSNAGFTAVQNYSYDSLNRLKDAKETISNNQTWKQTFQFDRFGNRTFDTSNGNTTTLAANCPTNVCNPSANTTNNRLIGASYDSSGNTTIDAENRTFTYDAENKQIQVSNSSGIVGRYIYDGDGKRVKKLSAAEITVFVYDAGGKMVAEYSTATNPTPQTSYLTSDNLGTPRISTDQNGTVISRHDYQPFGEEAVTAQRVNRSDYQGDAVRNEFTGYQKDEETDLDFAQARYFDSVFGRFSSPDPLMASASATNPQSLNRYIYVGNNPLNITDPTGLSWYFNKNIGETGSYKWYGDDETVGEGYVSVVGDSGQAGSYVYQSGNQWISLNMYSNSWKPFDTQAAATSSFNDQCRGCQELVNTIADESETKGKVVAVAAAGAVVVGTGVGAAMAVTGTAAGTAVTTLGVTDAAVGAGTTAATAAAANTDQTTQLIQGGTNVVYQGIDKVTGLVRYVGITQRDPAVRFGEHLRSGSARSLLDYDVISGATNLTRIDARIIEQNLINQHGLDNLENVRNSIAPQFWSIYGIH